MSTASFAEYLAALDEAALVRVLKARPDVRTEPAPGGFDQLAQRLCLTDSLSEALRLLTLDLHIVGQAIAVLGPRATVASIAELLAAPERAVAEAVDELCGRGLAWTAGGALRLPELVAEYWIEDVGSGRPVPRLARAVPMERLREAVQAFGIDTSGLRKAELTRRLAEALADRAKLVTMISALPGPARRRLDRLRYANLDYDLDLGVLDDLEAGDLGGTTDALVRAGLVVRLHYGFEVPWEVAAAAWCVERRPQFTSRPRLAAADTDAKASLRAGLAAAEALTRAVTAVLDHAGGTPVAALKKGGVGVRERTRLANRLSIPDQLLVLCIDLTYAAGLLADTKAGYAPTDRYPGWREAEPGQRWATLALAWFRLEFAPSYRVIDEDKDQPPPLPFISASGLIRRALLRSARPGLSLRSAGEHVDWFAPLHGYPAPDRDIRVASAIREAELLGVASGDRLTELGELLLASTEPDADTADDPADDPAGVSVAGLARRANPLFPDTTCTVIFQSDLTAVVSGQPSAEVARLLSLVSVSEARDTAGVWRFTPASVRAALDAGWRADELAEALAALADAPLPQPLSYLITDTARRHGNVRVRATRSTLVAEEALATELLHTRALGSLRLARLAPTVLVSPSEPDDVLGALRAAGFAPLAEDATGAVIIEHRDEHRAQAVPSVGVAERRPRRVPSAELASRLCSQPARQASLFDSDGFGSEYGGTADALALLNPRLTDAEILLLTDAIEHSREVSIRYRNKSGNRTVRLIRPIALYDKWLESWCHLRQAERDFTVANIETVAPVH